MKPSLNNIIRRETAMLLGASAASLYLANRFWLSRPFSFDGKSVLITGGSRGLGLELAKQLVKEGAKVAILARDAQELAKAASILESHALHPHLILPIICDVTNEEQARDAYYEVCEKFGSLDMLINNAGAILVGPAKSMTRADYMAQLELHLFAAMRFTELISNQHGCALSRETNKSEFEAKYLSPRKTLEGPRIVNIISMGGKVGVPHMLPYDVSKFALAGYSQGIRSELAAQGISVTNIYPALLQTGSPIQAVFKGDHEKEYAWFASADNLPGLSMNVETAARLIIEAARKRKGEVILSTLGKIREVLNAFIPDTMSSMMAILAATLPKGQSDEYKTGAEASSEFESAPLTRALSARAKKAAERNNQKPKTNAAFNLGLA